VQPKGGAGGTSPCGNYGGNGGAPGRVTDYGSAGERGYGVNAGAGGPGKGMEED
jgi:hypothetical protein